MEQSPAHLSAAIIRKIIAEKLPGFQPRAACILGSGLGGLADKMTSSITIPYKDLPGFPNCTVVDHAGELVIGTLQGAPVLCMKGRGHYYEGRGITVMNEAVRCFKLLGCEFVFITAAVGSLHKEVAPGSLVALTDHINMLGNNPLIGPNAEEFGPRFFSMANAYDADLRAKLAQAAAECGLPLPQGVYVSWTGPSFETAAEIRMMQIIGADVVGMSVAPDVIVARHCGLKVAAVAVATNYAEGLSDEPISGQQISDCATKASNDLVRLMKYFFAKLDGEK